MPIKCMKCDSTNIDVLRKILVNKVRNVKLACKDCAHVVFLSKKAFKRLTPVTTDPIKQAPQKSKAVPALPVQSSSFIPELLRKPIYPFVCVICGILVKSKRIGSKKAHNKRHCRLRCDGIQRDLGGFPLNSKLRTEYIAVKNTKKKAKNKCNLSQSGHELWWNGVKLTFTGKPYNSKKGFTFTDSREWKLLKYKALVKYGSICAACRDTKSQLHVDHIKPKSKYPDLAFDLDNLQVLCESCNMAKGTWDETDWRNKTALNL